MVSADGPLHDPGCGKDVLLSAPYSHLLVIVRILFMTHRGIMRLFYVVMTE